MEWFELYILVTSSEFRLLKLLEQGIDIIYIVD